jgi:hemerythrin-like domain-containing protein
MQATQILRQEHRVIEQALAVLAGMVNRLRQGQGVNEKPVAALLEFFVEFADGCHHAKEEGTLFPRLERGGIPKAGGPIGVMLYEHEHGRQLIRAMQEALSHWDQQPSRQQFCEAADQYVTLLRQHIWKEDNVLFMLAERVLPAAEDQVICSEFAQHEAQRVGPGKHEHYHQLIEALAREFEVPAVPASPAGAPPEPGCGCAHAFDV